MFIYLTNLTNTRRPSQYSPHATLDTFLTLLIRHFKGEKGTGAEIRHAIVSGIVTGDAPVSYWSIFSCPW